MQPHPIVRKQEPQPDATYLCFMLMFGAGCALAGYIFGSLV